MAKKKKTKKARLSELSLTRAYFALDDYDALQVSVASETLCERLNLTSDQSLELLAAIGQVLAGKKGTAQNVSKSLT